MGRPPCCDKVGIKKGPWTPEEDIILVSYIQEHGPGNWRAVPTNTGLMRCSKSCRLRWTNYLRPGIKRGNFTPSEEGMIIHLQALLGNKWAAIATYLPQRTDNDIKNYWNTHLKKKLKKFHQSGFATSSDSSANYHHHQFMSRADTEERVGPTDSRQAGPAGSSVYASSAENISRLLKGWMMTSSSPSRASGRDENRNVVTAASASIEGCLNDNRDNGVYCYGEIGNGGRRDLEGSLSFDREKMKRDDGNELPPLSFLENWLMDENAGQVGGMELSSIF